MGSRDITFQIVSDLHLETHPSYHFDFPRTADYLALLGDIGHVEKQALFNFLETQLLRYKAVFFLLGNHEPFHLSMEFAKKKVKKFAAKHKSFIFLDKTRYDMHDIVILGCTLYSRVTSEQARAVQSRMVDFKDILHWDVGDHVDAHLEDLQWLNDEVQKIISTTPEKRIVIFSHHSPCTDDRATNPRYRGSEVSSGFATDLSDELCWKNASLWAFGHTHYNCDFMDGDRRVMANQRGYYMRPQQTFQAGKSVEVPVKSPRISS